MKSWDTLWTTLREVETWTIWGFVWTWKLLRLVPWVLALLPVRLAQPRPNNRKIPVQALYCIYTCRFIITTLQIKQDKSNIIFAIETLKSPLSLITTCAVCLFFLTDKRSSWSGIVYPYLESGGSLRSGDTRRSRHSLYRVRNNIRDRTKIDWIVTFRGISLVFLHLKENVYVLNLFDFLALEIICIVPLIQKW